MSRIFKLLTIATSALAAATAHANDVVDQSTFGPVGSNDSGIVSLTYISIPSGDIPIYQSTFQTVTAGVSGLLSGIDLKLAYVAGSHTLNFALFDSGLQDGTASYSYQNMVYATAVQVEGSDMAVYHIDLSGADFAVSAGDVFGFSLRPDDMFSWVDYASSPTAYAGGSNYIAPNSGLPYSYYSYRAETQFQTYVSVPESNSAPSSSPGTVPEPANWAMMLAGFAIVGGSMRFRRRTSSALLAAL